MFTVICSSPVLSTVSTYETWRDATTMVYLARLTADVRRITVKLDGEIVLIVKFPPYKRG